MTFRKALDTSFSGQPVGQGRDRIGLSKAGIQRAKPSYATAARDAKKISIGIVLCSRQVTAIGRLPSWVT